MFHYSFPKILRILNPETHLAQGIWMRNCKLMLPRREMKVAQLCPTFCDPMDCSPPGSSVHRILQARILAWVAIPFSRGSSQPRDWTQVSGIVGRLFTLWAPKEAHAPAPQCQRPGFDPWVGKIPWRRERQPTPVFFPGESHGLRSLAGYSPWGHKKSDTTERFSLRSLFSSGFCPHSSVMLILFAQLLAISLDDGGCCCCC